MLFVATLLPLLLQAQNSNPSDGYVVALQDSKNFCLIVSPRNSNIAGAEKEAKAACFGSPSGAKPGFDIPQNMIQSAHFVKTKYYSQVTGMLDGRAYGYANGDQGTQFDDSLASQGGVLPQSGCVGFGQYLEYLSSSIYCLRCCNDAFSNYCDPTSDKRGCYAGIPGDYGPGFTESYQEPAKADPVTNYHGCAPKVDTCATSGFVCCNSKGDNAAGLSSKTTCQSPGDCSSRIGSRSAKFYSA